MVKTIFVLSTIAILLVGVISSQAWAFTIVDSDRPINETSEWVRYIQHGPYKAIANVKLTTFSNSGIFVTGYSDYPGVVKLILKNGPTYLCTGTLLNDQQHILTAAHCVTSSNTGKITLKNGSYAEFTNPDGTKSRFNIDASSTAVPAAWDANYLKGNDLAILKLNSVVPYTGYSIDSDMSGDLNNEVYKVGFGRSGTGWVGDVQSSGTKRDGSNQYDTTHNIMMSALGYSYIPDAVLQYDFDNNNSVNDAFGFFFSSFGLADTNTFGDKEINSAPGDSGGPTFNSEGKITGVTSYGISLQYNNGATSDYTPGLDSSFGEFSGDTRVAFTNNLNFILSIVPGATGTSSTNHPPIAVDDGSASSQFATTDEDTSIVTGNVLANDTDEDDGDTLVVLSYDSQSTNGAKITGLSGGTFGYDPTDSSTINNLDDGKSLFDTFDYTISDGNGGTSSATVTIRVDGITDVVIPGPSGLQLSFQNDHDDDLGLVNTVYTNRETMHIFGLVIDGNGQPVSAASVIVKILGANGKVGVFSESYLTDSEGEIHIHYKVQVKRFGEGTNYIFGDASLGETNTSCDALEGCSSEFTTESSNSKSSKSQKP